MHCPPFHSTVIPVSFDLSSFPNIALMIFPISLFLEIEIENCIFASFLYIFLVSSSSSVGVARFPPLRLYTGANKLSLSHLFNCALCVEFNVCLLFFTLIADCASFCTFLKSSINIVLIYCSVFSSKRFFCHRLTFSRSSLSLFSHFARNSDVNFSS